MNIILKKGLILLTTIWLVMTATFFLMKAVPGDPFSQEQDIPKEIMDSLYAHYGLDKPLITQYLQYIKGFCSFDFGPSIIYEGRSASQIIKEGFPVSATLGLEALFLSLLFGITLGSMAASFRGKGCDLFLMIFATAGVAVPNFLLATLLQYVFAMKLGLLPVARWGTALHTILPAIALSALPTAFIARLVRANMVEVLEQDYIKTARSKGLSEYRLIVFHGLRNALLPVFGYLGPVTAHILTGSFIIEKIFGIPGLGQWLIVSISNRDYPLIMGLVVFCSTLLIIMIYLVDIIYTIIDPRIHKQKYENI